MTYKIIGVDYPNAKRINFLIRQVTMAQRVTWTHGANATSTPKVPLL